MVYSILLILVLTSVVESGTKFYVNVRTTDRYWAGTDANVMINLHGTNNSTGWIDLDTPRDDFQVGHLDQFVVDSETTGKLQQVDIKRDSAGSHDDWHPEKVTILGGGWTYTINLNFWLDAHRIYSYRKLNSHDINECLEKTFKCPTHSACVNTQGSYRCDCQPGFLKNSNTGLCDPSCSIEPPSSYVQLITSGTSIPVDHVAQYQCEKGYVPVTGDTQRTCAGGKRLTGSSLKCVKDTSCSTEEPTANVTLVTTDTSLELGQVAEYQCNQGYVHLSGDTMRTCTDGNILTGSSLQCVKDTSCSTEEPTANVTLVTTDTSLELGQVAEYRCAPGYVPLSGDTMRTCTDGNILTGSSLQCIKEIVNVCPNIANDRYTSVHGETCYRFVLGSDQYFSRAAKHCMQNGGMLALIKDEETSTFLTNQIKEHDYETTGYWIGMYLGGKSWPPKWKWVDGTYASEDQIPRSARLPGQNCVILRANGRKGYGVCETTGGMDIASRDDRKPFICQYPTVTTSPPNPPAPPSPAPTARSTMTTPRPTCPPFVCSLDCGMDGYKTDSEGCSVCQCDYDDY